MSKFYTGIGSRQTPENILETMKDIALYLNHQEYILRSGGAKGADVAFELGSLNLKKVYLPWPGFNNSKEPYVPITKEAEKMAEKYHPWFYNLKQGARKLHSRNCYQVLGENLDTPSDFLICWTPGGLETGGTSQALRIAKDYNVKIYNLAKDEDLEYWRKRCMT
ncbi:MAG: hypothetical protein J7L15_08725 [Clostridiales bacterium]|nr:hypothetical protein [Clostridiales bacterium]